MKWCDHEFNEHGELVRACYVNGFTFEGLFDGDENPIFGIIKNEKGEIVFEGELKADISEYFQKYNKTKRPIK